MKLFPQETRRINNSDSSSLSIRSDQCVYVCVLFVSTCHKVHIYLEFFSSCPLVGIGTPVPPPTLSRKQVWGGTHWAAGA